MDRNFIACIATTKNNVLRSTIHDKNMMPDARYTVPVFLYLASRIVHPGVS